jgi:predicted TIM-barrel fold metal-dependent hydrolase
MKVIDAHTHVASTRYMPQAFLEGIVDNMLEQLRPYGGSFTRNGLLDRVLSSYQDHDAAAQLAGMDELGIAQSVLLLPDFTYALAGQSLTIAEMFEQHRALLQKNPDRFRVFAGVDPRWGSDALPLFVKGIEQYGFSGLKLYPPCGYTPDSPLLDPFYEYCDSKGLPVLMHMGPTSPVLSFNEAHPRFVDRPARKYRRISFILAHGAVNHPEACIQLCRYRPNVFLDISGAKLETDLTALKALVEAGISHKVLFGSDWPIVQPKATRALLDRCRGQDVGAGAPLLPSNAARWVLAGNVDYILGKAKETA